MIQSAHPQGQGDGGELLDAVKPQLNIFIPQLVNEHRYGVEGVIASIRGHIQHNRVIF